LTDFTNKVISNYGKEDKNGIMFNNINTNVYSIAQYKKIKNLTRYINDRIKRIAKANDLPGDLSTN
jgi:hypothetical protein